MNYGDCCYFIKNSNMGEAKVCISKTFKLLRNQSSSFKLNYKKKSYDLEMFFYFSFLIFYIFFIYSEK